MKWSNEEKIQFLKDWPILNKEELLNKYSRSYNSLKSLASDYGIKKFETQNKYKLKILLDNSYESLYWLGFIMADGHISKSGELRITLNIKDRDHLQKLATKLKIKLHERPAKFQKYKINPTCVISCKDVIYGPKILQFFNIIESKKTYHPISLNNINITNLLPFLAGLIDGDGCFCKDLNKKINMIRIQCHNSWLIVYQKISILLNNFNVNSKVFIDKQGYCKFIISKKQNIKNFINLVKSYNLPLLERKWNLSI